MRKIGVLASLALIGLIGCTDNRSTTDRTGQTTSPSERSTAGSASTAPAERPSPSAPGAPPAATTSMSEADRTLAQRVEDALRKNTTLASAAQNVQVYANNGEITLRGSVSSEQEKTNMVSAAQQVAGVTRVNNQLEVASASR
ncbi:MAG TPA: BON domain-containing protein [Methylomirabilota bacterium]|nr:BON domain-containing protein [Methylomirabilota bacterium]